MTDSISNETRTGRGELLERMWRLALLDPLTGILNRRGLEEALDQACQFGRRHHHEVGLLIIDIDHFKQINDTHGHPAGDQVLKEFAELIRARVRASDIVCRYGGDEMVVILPISAPADIRGLAERLLREFRGRAFGGSELALRVTASIGGAASHPEAGGSPAEILKRADEALYAAKRGGRDRAFIADEI